MIAASFPEASFQANGSQLRIAAAPFWGLEDLGRLIGQLDDDAALEMAAFFELQGPADERAPELGLPPGVYVTFVSLEGARLHAEELSLLEEGLESIATVKGTDDLSPFQQGTLERETRLSVSPALVADVEGDGRDEMVLALSRRREAYSQLTYLTYRLEAAERTWQRLDETGGKHPPLAILEYWANVSTAVDIASRWEPETRLRLIWRWLADENAPLPAETVRALAPGGPSERAQVAAALIFLRDSFRRAYSTFTPDLRVRQPWAGFVNGFRNTEKAALETIGATLVRDVGVVEVKVTLALTVREGEEARTRRFLVTFDMEQLGGRWFLDDLDAKEQPQGD
ncbi:MAG: hypothetical protein ACE5KW_06500 [Dehalococcoidia bacterium]